eukprot:scaffold1692_cov288-Pavlova_lutheri.AAC.2
MSARRPSLPLHVPSVPCPVRLCCWTAEIALDRSPKLERNLAGFHCLSQSFQVLTEAAGILEHGLHVGHLAGVPAPNVLVEAAGRIEHVEHVGHTPGVPAPDVLVEAAGRKEHAPHVGHLAGVPAPDVLVEAAGNIEHVGHVGHTAGVPASNVLVEATGKIEHISHICHLAGVPAPDVLVEAAGTLEHASHVGHLASVPASNVLSKPTGTTEHETHVGHTAGVPGGDVAIEGVGIDVAKQRIHVRDPACAGGGRVGWGDLFLRALGVHHAGDCPRLPKTCGWTKDRHAVVMQHEGGGRTLRCDDRDHGDPRPHGPFPSRASGCTVPSRIHRWRPCVHRIARRLGVDLRSLRFPSGTCAGAGVGRSFLHTRAMRARVVHTASDTT